MQQNFDIIRTVTSNGGCRKTSENCFFFQSSGLSVYYSYAPRFQHVIGPWINLKNVT